MNKRTSLIANMLTALVLTFNGYTEASASSATAPLLAVNTYYVSASGSDAGACAQSTPCKTITRGISVAQNGDTVSVAAGVYHEYVYVNKSITLTSNGATIDGANATGQVRDGLFSVFADNVTVSGFTIVNAANYGLANFGNNSRFTNNIIHNTQGPGIWMRDGKFNTFEGNELYYTVLKNSVSFDGTYYLCSPTTTGWPSAINSWGAAGSNMWRGNYVHDNCGEGIVTYTGDLVENNTFKNNWGVEIYITADKTTVRNNTILDTKPYAPRGSDQSWRSVPAGIAIGDEAVCLTDNNSITGNTITGARYGISFYPYITCSGIKNTLIENNTFVNIWEYGLRILNGAHSNSIIRNNTIKLTSGKPLTVQNGSGFAVTGNLFSSNADVFEWNGKTYNFAGWNALVPGNFWETTATPTAARSPEPPPITTATPTTVFTQTPEPTATQTTIVETATPLPIGTPLVTATTAPTGQTAIVSASPKTVLVGETSLVSVSMVNVPVEGYTSVEFTCAFAPDIIKAENIQVAALFGGDPVSVFQDLQNGSFILAIAGSNGNKALGDGVAFTFTAGGLKAGQSSLDCAARILAGDNTLTGIASVPDTLTVLDASPTATPILPPTLTGQVFASKQVTISLLNADSSLAASAIANPDGTFSLTAQPGSYVVVASAEGCLDAQGIVTLMDGVASVMPTITLPAGDIDGNDVIDQYDALTLGMNYNLLAPAPADLSNDGRTNILDLEMLAENYRKAGALSWQ